MLITFEEYRKLRGELSIIDLLAMPATEDMAFESTRAGKLHRGVDLS